MYLSSKHNEMFPRKKKFDNLKLNGKKQNSKIENNTLILFYYLHFFVFVQNTKVSRLKFLGNS